MKGDPVYYFPETIELLTSIKRDSTVFVETGTCGGQTVKAASLAGFEKIYSMEIDEEQYNKTRIIFQDANEPLDTQIFLYLGDSRVVLPKILKLIPEDYPSIFFIDAHSHIHGVAAYEELAIIKTHCFKSHTILVDDIPLYFGDCSLLKKYLLDINPDYKFELLDCEIRKKYPTGLLSGFDMRMLAYI